jgi:hypothetical protein
MHGSVEVFLNSILHWSIFVSALVELEYNFQSNTRVNNASVEPEYNLKSNYTLFLNVTLFV